jgi:hypothetical protein
MEVSVEIETHDRRLSSDLFEAEEMEEGMEKEIAENLVIKHKGDLFALAEGMPLTILLAFEFGTKVAAIILADWLFEKIQNKTTKLKIEGVEVRLEKGEIKRILIDKIEKTEK